MEEAANSRQRHLVIVPCLYEGHLNPMLQLGSILKSKGNFSITIVHTKYNSPNPSNHPQFDFVPIPDEQSDHLTAIGDLISAILKLNIDCKKPFQELMARWREQQDQREGITCIIYDGIMYFAEEVARDLKIPSFVFRTNCATNVSIYSEYTRLQEEGYIPLQDSKALEPVPRIHPLRFKDLPIYKFEGYEKLLQLINRARQIGSTVAVLVNTVECLEKSPLTKLRREHAVPVLAIGPLHKFAPAFSSSLIQEDESCIAWLNKQTKNSVLYVSLGSIASISEKELTEMAWGLANSKQPFLWVIRPGSVHGSEWVNLLPAGFRESVGERCCIIKWAPQKKVLAHESVGGFWSHCGWNSTLESISEGVPMLCTPCFGDQRVNSRYLSHVWRVGLVLEDMERGEVERAVKRLMISEEGEEMRRRTEALKGEIRRGITEGGSSDSSLNELVKYIQSF